MERTVRKFSSHAEADRADREYYLSLTPEQRMEIFLQILETHREAAGESAKGFERVCRIVKRPRR